MTKIISKSTGFTIVELLVVIVVIGILAAITIVSYTGINQKAVIASLQSDLSGASTKLKMFYVEYGKYPEGLDGNDCPTVPADTKYCIKSSPGNDFTYSSSTPFSTFSLDAVNGTTYYNITNNSAPSIGSPPVATVTIGTQTWMQYNMNVGTMISGSTSQTNNSILEKWCYNNIESNCTTYGGLYQWDEMMQYVTTDGARGICPTGFHIATTTEWTTLENYLGPATAGTQLKSGGSSGFNGLLTGGWFYGSFVNLEVIGPYWTSTQSGPNAWYRRLMAETVYSTDGYVKTNAYSARCIKN